MNRNRNLKKPMCRGRNLKHLMDRIRKLTQKSKNGKERYSICIFYFRLC